uniref:C-type lectin domain-containing protein n=1 Tax=Sinocyclocheilus grahami TaxID=75366 RepID=A0A672KEL0_SINGR
SVRTKRHKKTMVYLVLQYATCVLCIQAVIGKLQFSVDENKELVTKLVVLPDGWMCYQSGLYYISSTKKSWNDSKQDCSKRRADLMIINSKEQKFFENYGEFWIGLTGSDVEGRWKWVDGSTLTSGQMETVKKNCVVTSSSGWRDYSCEEYFKWICERKTS